MKRIKEIEQVVAELSYEQKEISRTFARAYVIAQFTQNEAIDFFDPIWDSECERFFENLDRFEINECTISCQSTALMETMKDFADRGWKLLGMTEVNASFDDFTTGKPVKLPAVRFCR